MRFNKQHVVLSQGFVTLCRSVLKEGFFCENDLVL